MTDISVIVPVYNAELYLRTCVECIRSQTFRNFELILIDDGSVDRSAAICNEYVEKDSRVKVIHQNNQGPSAARNRGMKESEGKYITFVDADDCIEKCYLENLWRITEDYGADLVISGMFLVEDGQKPGSRNNLSVPAGEMTRRVSRQEAYRCMLGGKRALLFAWGKLYCRRLLRDISYPEGEVYEDVKVICKIIEKADNIVCTPYTGYFYIQRPDSITHSSMSQEHKVLLRNEIEFWNFIKIHYPELEYLAKEKYFRSCFFLLEKMSEKMQYGKECRKLRKSILKNWRYLLFNKTVSRTVRGGTLCLLFGIPCYRTVWKLYRHLFYYKF